ncbi:calcium uniporter protein, mitochondrial [Anopheles ziemanni]|uniref:calcium uniporter protein, mitochondrial n=1 Tax=Anopheles coustani TaxID=139045 RepID=UPI00265A4CB8|nr:calcium uniporter protein, mitochondrial [Anopheles coustani]XP_058124063.1 calcium uniporter protein, mitochondrial [Anopheles coustani]XP_058124064.1 calcium uniporter protein, mitochondrial [Anopheles coustani]XP_058124066.1 calcium uniporter protein, mitochondrial [Anopheles coustani]XP_058173929.1 calcium uniporter protein, mitochondrial [Anopheles ziemanni]
MAAPRVASTGGFFVNQMLMFWPERLAAGASRSTSSTLLASLARHQLLQKKPLVLDVSRRFSTAAAASGYSNKSYKSNRKSSIIHGVGYREYNTSSSRSASSSGSSNLSSTSTGTSKADIISPEEVTVRYNRGLPNVTVPLPSRNERCQFTLRPVTHSVGDFLEMLKVEDRGIDRAAVLNREGVRIAAACSIENLMADDFWLHLNDRQYYVKPPKREKITSEEITRLGDVQALVAQLYEALHVGEHQIHKERELNGKLEELTVKLGPLEEKKNELDQIAARKTNVLTWVGLGLMSVQFGVLARLTWWEYSWDIMEPVTYFVTYGTAMAAYAYFVLTKQEYLLPDVKDRQHLITLHKAAKKAGINLAEYNDIKRQIAEIEHDLRRLRDPLYMHLPAPPPKSKTYSATEIALSKKQKKAAFEASLGVPGSTGQQ